MTEVKRTERGETDTAVLDLQTDMGRPEIPAAQQSSTVLRCAILRSEARRWAVKRRVFITLHEQEGAQ